MIIVQVASAIGVILLAAHLSRKCARLLGQPAVVVEISFGLLLAPSFFWMTGGHRINSLISEEGFQSVTEIGHVGLALFLVGVGHEIRQLPLRALSRKVACITTGSFLVPLAAGSAFACWILGTKGQNIRGTAPPESLILLMAAAFSVSAVPVLARILDERNMLSSDLGKLSITIAIMIDAAAWLLLTLSIAISKDDITEFIKVFCWIALVVVIPYLILRYGTRNASRNTPPPILRFLLLCCLAVLGAKIAKHAGLTEIMGALAIGISVPPIAHWSESVRRVSHLGTWLIPIFFVTAGTEIFSNPSHSISAPVVAIAILLAFLGKVAGTYLGVKIGGGPAREAPMLAILLNTRGLTEIALLQAGYNAGIITSQLFATLTIMALATTIMTGPCCSIIERFQKQDLYSTYFDRETR